VSFSDLSAKCSGELHDPAPRSEKSPQDELIPRRNGASPLVETACHGIPLQNGRKMNEQSCGLSTTLQSPFAAVNDTCLFHFHVVAGRDYDPIDCFRALVFLIFNSRSFLLPKYPSIIRIGRNDRDGCRNQQRLDLSQCDISAADHRHGLPLT
jgi:hypothetical protein